MKDKAREEKQPEQQDINTITIPQQTAMVERLDLTIERLKDLSKNTKDIVGKHTNIPEMPHAGTEWNRDMEISLDVRIMKMCEFMDGLIEKTGRIVKCLNQ